MATKRVFIAHPKAMDGSDLGKLKQDIERVFKAGAGAHRIEATLGRDDHALNFARCGGWDAWAADVATGIKYISREPRYHAIVVPSGPVGKATASIVEMALGARKRVFEWDAAAQKLSRVEAVVQVSDSFKDGWRLQVTS